MLFKAAVSGLQNQPIVNAVIDGDDIMYREYIDISIAVGTPKVCFIPWIQRRMHIWVYVFGIFFFKF